MYIGGNPGTYPRAQTSSSCALSKYLFGALYWKTVRLAGHTVMNERQGELITYNLERGERQINM